MRETIPQLQIPQAVLDFCEHCDHLAKNGTCLIRSITLQDRNRFVTSGYCGKAEIDKIPVNMTTQGPQLKELSSSNI